MEGGGSEETWTEYVVDVEQGNERLTFSDSQGVSIVTHLRRSRQTRLPFLLAVKQRNLWHISVYQIQARRSISEMAKGEIRRSR